MKAHQSIIVIALSCLLLLASACGKKSVRSVSGEEDLFASQDNHEVTGHDKALYGDPRPCYEAPQWQMAVTPGQWKRYQPPIFTTRKAGPRSPEEDKGALRPFSPFRREAEYRVLPGGLLGWETVKACLSP